MTIRLYDFDFNDTIVFGETNGVCLTVENRKLFASLYRCLIRTDVEESDREIALFDDKGNMLVSKKDYVVIVDLADYETVSKTIGNKAIKALVERCDTDADLSYGLKRKINELYVEALKAVNDFDIEFDSESDCAFEDVFKLFSVTPSSGGGVLLDKYLNLIELVSRLKLYKALVFFNAKAFMSSEELAEIQKLAAYKNVKLFFIENKLYPDGLPYEDKYLIDEDLFLTKLSGGDII